MEHSKTPWKIGTPPPNGEQTIGTTDGMMVAVATTGAGVDAKANARRIVACVNACRDIETGVLEMQIGSTALFGRIAGSLTGENMRLRDDVQKLQAQRDALLVALDELVEIADNGCADAWRDEWDKARAAIQQVRSKE